MKAVNVTEQLCKLYNHVLLSLLAIATSDQFYALG